MEFKKLLKNTREKNIILNPKFLEIFECLLLVSYKPMFIENMLFHDKGYVVHKKCFMKYVSSTSQSHKPFASITLSFVRTQPADVFTVLLDNVENGYTVAPLRKQKIIQLYLMNPL